MTYAGLTTADKLALLDAKKNGALWIARDEDGAICGHQEKPEKSYSNGFYGNHWKTSYPFLKVVGFELDQYCDLRFVQWIDSEPVNIDLALAQIAEMESETMTNADHWIDIWKNDVLLMARMFVYEQKSESGDFEYLVSDPDGTEIALMDSYCEAIKRAVKFLHSPYTEGETK